MASATNILGNGKIRDVNGGDQLLVSISDGKLDHGEFTKTTALSESR
ncbi:hypothetical protein [Anabaena azotica]|uniref:Uncharacterized protein n=1 Tax=Anabaena azotica FACHB-119 TaxID=947527 RepID=A0ABR8CWD9_9NOST|nr:hypothetical protein [Anabaena azotica]MBD2499259.1 hypothetical protein [Anabaena azotica FACHB-119]